MIKINITLCTYVCMNAPKRLLKTKH